MPGKDGVVVNSSKAENVVAAKSTYWLSQWDEFFCGGALLCTYSYWNFDSTAFSQDSYDMLIYMYYTALY